MLHFEGCVFRLFILFPGYLWLRAWMGSGVAGGAGVGRHVLLRLCTPCIAGSTEQASKLLPQAARVWTGLGRQMLTLCCFLKQGEPRSCAWAVGGLPCASLARQGWGTEGLLGAGILLSGARLVKQTSWLLCFESSLKMAQQRIGQASPQGTSLEGRFAAQRSLSVEKSLGM